ncbi:hypothetical protein [Flindersiella endophytica]
MLVYRQTLSVALTGLAYALTYLPSVLGGLALSWIGDRTIVLAVPPAPSCG